MRFILKILIYWIGIDIVFATSFALALKYTKVREGFVYRLNHRSNLRLVKKD